MPRPTRQEIDEEIVDKAAELFARHGFEQTSVQRIADAVGYSKTGLLHRFPSKEALRDAVVHQCAGEVRGVAESVRDLPPGPGRDRRAVEALVDLALRRPGAVALMLGLFGSLAGTDFAARLARTADDFFRAFATTPSADPGRDIRVLGVLGAVGLTALVARDFPAVDARAHIVAAACATLQEGHSCR